VFLDLTTLIVRNGGFVFNEEKGLNSFYSIKKTPCRVK